MNHELRGECSSNCEWILNHRFRSYIYIYSMIYPHIPTFWYFLELLSQPFPMCKSVTAPLRHHPSLKNSGFSHVHRHFPCFSHVFSHGFPSGEFEVYEITKNPIRLEVLRVGPVANHLPKPAHHIALLSHVGRFARANFWYILTYVF